MMLVPMVIAFFTLAQSQQDAPLLADKYLLHGYYAFDNESNACYALVTKYVQQTKSAVFPKWHVTSDLANMYKRDFPSYKDDREAVNYLSRLELAKFKIVFNREIIGRKIEAIRPKDVLFQVFAEESLVLEKHWDYSEVIH